MVRVLPERRLRQHAVGPEACPLGDGADVRQGVGMDDVRLVERARNRRGRHPRFAGNLDDGKAGRCARRHGYIAAGLLKTFSSYKTNMTFVLHPFALCC